MAATLALLSVAAQAQDDSTQTSPKPKTTVSVNNLPRSADHFMLQLGYTGWAGAPDSIKTGGVPRTFNLYVMMDFPFKTSPNWSVALGVGIATDNVYFDKTALLLNGTTTNLVFQNQADTTHFKRYKLATSYAEVPLELRFSSSPNNNSRSFKVALGAKVGLLLNAHTKGNTLQNSAGNTLNDYKEKIFAKDYFNRQRISATARVGVGSFTLFGSYQLTPLFKEGVAAAIRPYTVGLTLSGL